MDRKNDYSKEYRNIMNKDFLKKFSAYTCALILSAQICGFSLTDSFFSGQPAYVSAAEDGFEKIEGTEISWKIDGDTLTVKGKGTMGSQKLPWYENNEIKTVIIEEGITELPDYCFLGLYGLTTVKLPNTLEVISNSAFANCISLEELLIPYSVKKIYDKAFFGCENLHSITFFNSLFEIFAKDTVVPDHTTIISFSDSTGERYATKFKKEFKEMSRETDADSMKIVSYKSWNVPVDDQKLLIEVKSFSDGSFTASCYAKEKGITLKQNLYLGDICFSSDAYDYSHYKIEDDETIIYKTYQHPVVSFLQNDTKFEGLDTTVSVNLGVAEPDEENNPTYISNVPVFRFSLTPKIKDNKPARVVILGHEFLINTDTVLSGESSEKYSKFDLNRDGKVNVLDFLLLKKFLLGSET